MRHIIVNTTYPGTQLKMPNHLIQETNRYITALCESFGFDSYTCISSQDPSEIQPEHIGSPWRHVVLDDLLDPNPETGFFSKTMKNLTKTLNVAPDDTVMLASPYNDVIAKEDYEFILDTHAANLDKIIVGARKINGNHHPSMLINVCDADRVKKGFCLHAKRSESPWRAFLDKSTLISFPPEKDVKGSQFLPPLYKISNHLIACTFGQLESCLSPDADNILHVPLASPVPKNYPALALPYFMMASKAA